MKTLLWILRLLVCFVLLFFLFKRVQFAEILVNLKKINFFLLIAIAALTLAGQALLILRWKSILTKLKVKLSFWRLFGYYFTGLFFNAFLPSTIGGDVVKGYYLYKDTKKLQISYFSIFADRYIGVFSLIFLAFLGGFFIDFNYNGISIGIWMSILLLLYIIISISIISPWVQKLVSSKRTKARFFYTLANSVSKAVKFIIINKGTFSVCFFYGLASYLTVVLAHYLLTIALGHPVSISLLFVYISIIALGTMMPVSINGIGLREFLYVYLFSFCGWDNSLSVSICWAVFGVFLMISAAGGIFYLFRREP